MLTQNLWGMSVTLLLLPRKTVIVTDFHHATIRDLYKTGNELLNVRSNVFIM